jgi:hypothetical protein
MQMSCWVVVVVVVVVAHPRDDVDTGRLTKTHEANR